MDHPLQQQQEEDASLFASPFSPIEQQHQQSTPIPNTAYYARGENLPAQTNTDGQQQMTSHQMSQQQQQPQHHTLQHTNTMPYPVNNITTNTESTVNNNNTAAAPIIGPRGKCDQVIYEAMTKACEMSYVDDVPNWI
eukprot:scaffold9868_cov84-Skeletonema_marinoi.AAC.2